MGLSAFNAMRAREKAKQTALANSSANVEVTEIEPENIAESVEVEKEETPAEEVEVEKEETPAEEVEEKPKKTDAEKLKKKNKE